jgi:hypothetical protein
MRLASNRMSSEGFIGVSQTKMTSLLYFGISSIHHVYYSCMNVHSFRTSLVVRFFACFIHMYSLGGGGGMELSLQKLGALLVQ